MAPLKTIFIIGGTGAQGLPIVRSLAATGTYFLRILTRDPSNERARELLSFAPDRVELQEGTFESEANLRRGFKDAWGAFVNLDGFVVGEKTETFWTMRAFELAVEHGLQTFVFGNLDYGYKKSGYKPEFRSGHYDGKGRLGEWMLDQNARNKASLAGYEMKVSLFTTGPYLDMAISSQGPMVAKVEKEEADEHQKGEEDVLTWRVPLTADGAVPHIALDDCGHYVQWLFEHPEEADGMDLAVAIEHIHYADLARAFAQVTGHKARFIDVDLETYWAQGPLAAAAERPAGLKADLNDPVTMTMRQNFSGFWSLWRASGYNKGLVRRDYALLDRIHPGRIRTAEKFLQRQDDELRKKGSSLWEKMVNNKPVLKLQQSITGR